MDTKELTAILVVAMVGCVIVAGFIPVVGETVEPNVKIINEGAYNLTDNDDDYTIIYDPSGKYIIGDKEVLFTDLPADAITIASAKDMLLRMQNWAPQNYNLWLFIDGQAARVIASNANPNPVTINFNNGVLTWDAQTNNYTSDDSFRVFNPDGAYTMTYYDQPATVLKDTTVIVGNGTTAVNAWTNRFYIEGTTDDITVTPATGITVSNVQVNTTAIPSLKDGVKLDSVTFTATDGENTVDATYNRVIVPIEIIAEKAIHADDNTASIISMIPIILILGIVVMFVGVVLVRRYV